MTYEVPPALTLKAAEMRVESSKGTSDHDAAKRQLKSIKAGLKRRQLKGIKP